MTGKQHEFLQPQAAADERRVDRRQAGPTARTQDTGATPRAAYTRYGKYLTACVGGITVVATTLLCAAPPDRQAGRLDRQAGPPDQQAGRLDRQAGRLDRQAGRLSYTEADAPLRGAAQAPAPVPVSLTSTPRPAIPQAASEVWLLPDRPVKHEKVVADFGNGVRLLQNARYSDALPLLTAPGLASTPLAQYAAYYTGLAYLNLSRASEARTIFAKLRTDKAPGFLAEAAPLREAEAAVAQGDQAGAAKLYEEASHRKTASPDALLLALARAYASAGDRQHAAETFARLYYEFPLSDLATIAATELDGLKDLQPVRESPVRFKLEMGRAERLFGAKRYQAAHQAFEALKPLSSGDDAELTDLRVAECDFYLHRYREAVAGTQPYLEKASRKAEAQFFHLASLRELGDHDEYVRRARALVAAFPESSWAEEALNNLATHYILTDEDDQADSVFRELYQRFPQGRHAERAAWKAGWFSYKHGRYAEASALFEGAASSFPRSDYRPAYLYWSSRARDAAGDKTGAQALMKVVASDYLNSYYGRLAVKRLGTSVAAASTAAVRRAVATIEGQPAQGEQKVDAAPEGVIRLLISLELYEAARDELLFAQRNGMDTPATNATLAWVYNKLGDYRRGIITMKRAYPSYMSAEAASLPNDLFKVIFPIDYWPLIRKFAPANNLDPYLVAALINQESSFLADAKSAANAVGLMQLLPSTARRYARSLRLKRYSASALLKPDVNIQLGTAYFAELSRRLGGVHYALASYNAGEHRVAIWTSERPGVDRDEFIDDIPFPETQGYVKKIIGTADDYRRLYGPDGEAPASRSSVSKDTAKKSQASARTPASKASANKKKPARKSTRG